MFSLVSKVAVSAALSHIGNSANFINNAAKMSQVSYETLSVTVPKEFVYHVELNRPDKMNAMNNTMWMEIKKCFETLNTDENCRAIVLSAAGKIFTCGLDFQQVMQVGPQLAQMSDIARKAKILYQFVTNYQNSVSSLELCRKPVLAAVHSACVGGGFNLITAADMRYCTKDAFFQLKEVDIGMAADVGALQRLPKVVGSDSLVRELSYTARKMPASEALSSGLVSKVFDDKDGMIEGVVGIAAEIASKSPVAVQGTKFNLVYSRDHTVQEGLDHIAMWNQAMMQSEDFTTATVAQATKQKDVVFEKL